MPKSGPLKKVIRKLLTVVQKKAKARKINKQLKESETFAKEMGVNLGEFQDLNKNMNLLNKRRSGRDLNLSRTWWDKYYSGIKKTGGAVYNNRGMRIPGMHKDI